MKKIKLYTSIILASSLLLFKSSFANTEIIDSLKAVSLASLNDTQKVNVQISIAQAYLDMNVDSSLHYAQLALKTSQSVSFSKGLIKGNNLLGNCAQRKGEFDEAMTYYEKVKQLSLAHSDDKGMAIVLNNIAIIHTQRGQYEAALDGYFEALDFEKKLNDQKGIAEAYNNIGVVHYYMGDMENTLKYLKMSAKITEEIGDLQVLKKAYMNIGAIHLHRKEFEKALESYQKGIDISKALNDLNDITIAHHNMANVYDKLGEYEKSESYYLKALEFHEKFDNKRGIALEHTNLGKLTFNQNRTSRSLDYYDKAILLAEEGGFRNIVSNAYAGKADVYYSIGEYQKAFDHLSIHLRQEDTLLNEESAKSIAELRTKYETVEKEKALAEEKEKSALLEKDKISAELESVNRRNWIVVLFALIIVGSLLFLTIVQRNKRKAQSEKDAAIIEERDKGALAVFAAQEEERKRISKDLHDGVGQQLSGLKMAFQKLANDAKDLDPEMATQTQKLSTILSESADEVRSISHQMMPKALIELGLIHALEDMLKKSLGINRINYEFEHFGIVERLEEKIEISVYRVAQELINNIVKHSESTHVSLQLFKNGGKLVFIVEDNGKGIKNTEGSGHGLLNMKSRINSLNGELNLEPSPSSGTLATIRIPI